MQVYQCENSKVSVLLAFECLTSYLFVKDIISQYMFALIEEYPIQEQNIPMEKEEMQASTLLPNLFQALFLKLIESMAVKPDSQCTNSSKVEFRNSPQQAVQDGFLHIPRAPENIPS